MARSKPDDPFGDDPFYNDAQEAQSSDEMPEGSVDTERSQFLKPHHLNASQGTLELVSTSGATEFSDVVLHVKLGSRPYRIGLKTFDPGYVALRKKFGPKREDWHGTLMYRVMPHKGQRNGYVTVRPK